MKLTKEMQYALDIVRFKNKFTYKQLAKETDITAKTLIKIINSDLEDESIKFSHTTIFKLSNYLAKQHTL
jgi:hypothetical protein